MWMNEYEVSEMVDLLAHRYEEVPNLYTAARMVEALVDWTNSNSDGWPYWPKPAKAASRLMDVLHSRDYAIRFGSDRLGQPLEDISVSDLSRLLAPVKAFLTRQGVEHRSALPFAAILP